jgi:hypothetical protein
MPSSPTAYNVGNSPAGARASPHIVGRNPAHAPRATASPSIPLPVHTPRLPYQSIPAQLPLPPNPQPRPPPVFPCQHAQTSASNQTIPRMATPLTHHVVASPSPALPATTSSPATTPATASSSTPNLTPRSVPVTMRTPSPRPARTHARPNTTAASTSTPRAARTTSRGRATLTTPRVRSASGSTTTA